MTAAALHKNSTDLLDHAVKIMHAADAGKFSHGLLKLLITNSLIFEFFPAAAMQQNTLWQIDPTAILF